MVREVNDQQMLEVALVENIQRADLNPIEEARGFRQLMDEFDHTQASLAEVVGKSRSHIANSVRLLGLPEDILGLLRDGQAVGRPCSGIAGLRRSVGVGTTSGRPGV